MDPGLLICFAAVFILVSDVCGECNRNQWQCDDGVCIPHRWHCDGVSDCQDGSDEMACSCPPKAFECADGSGCVTESLACDGRAQCSDGSDELDCDWRSGCLSRDWKCRNNICIPQNFICNEVNDCGDNSDEETCGSCGKMKIRCPDGRCLTQREMCDGVAQCTDRRDEPHTCGKSCRNANGGCSHTCVDQTWGALCICPRGMTLSANGLDCKDVDECSQSFGQCMHLCTNTPGSFRCLCQNGFKSLGNGSCEAQGFPVKILTFRKPLIGLVNVKTRVFEPLLSIESDPIALTYDIQKNLIYWADNHGNIYKASNHKSMVLYSGQPGVRSLAVDWLTGQLFWTSVTQKAIFTGSTDGSSACVVISKDTDPGDVVLSPVESFIFWINRGTSEEITIERTAMDGLNRTTLIFVTAQIPKGLTLDVAARRLYWISEFKMSIESIRTDGSGSYTFWNIFQGSSALSLAVFNGWFYWADEKRLWQTPQNLPTAKYNEFLLKASLPVLTVYHELQQPRGFSPCKNSRCKLCLPSKKSPVGFTCLCPEGMLPVAYGSCENFKVAYATATVIYSLEFTGNTTIKTELFTSDEDIQAFDMHWKRGCVVWCNGTGHVKTNRLSRDMSEYILTLKPACVVRVDQKTGNLYWLACDELSIGVSTIGPLHQSISRQLYQARTAILDLFVDWQKGKLYWLEGGQIMRMKLGLIGGRAEAVFSLEENGFGTIAFDRKANSFLWNGGSFLQVMSLLKARKYSGGKKCVIPGSIVAAYEPYVVALFSNFLSVWNRKDRTRISEVAVENDIVGLSVALREVVQDDVAEDVRPTEVTCISPLVLCPGSTVCISQSQQCDGKSDCPGGSDEAFCLYTCAKPGEFLCEDRRNCVERNLVCDGHTHCPDGSDEVGCPSAAPATSTTTTSSLSLKCRMGSIPCKDARECVLYSHVCDGEIDCKDGSDEDDCELQCKTDQFHCAHGRMCIDKKLVCDGTPQCQDRSDEADCFIRSHDCKHHCDNKTRCIPESFLCDGDKDCMDNTDEENCNEINSGNLNLAENKGVSTLVASQPPVCRSPSMMCPGTLLCISQTRLCDGKLDCPDGSDEVSCIDTCAKIGDFLCKDRRKCVERNLVCDGQSHCLDGSDEVTCPLGRSRTSTTASLKCRVGSKPCQDGRECVMHSHVCDGEIDCKDGSDEVDCELQCKPDQFHCAHGRMCIDKIQVCDGTPQCQDRSDETDCFTRSHDCKHRCDNKTRCIPESFLCDGEKDCVDATDEANCTEINSGNLNLLAVKKGASTFVASRPPVCKSPSIMCPGSSLCISQTRLCDGKLDCPDGSDEVSCIDICAKIGDFLCKDRRKCVERSLICDGRSHCLDGSDEVGCPIRGSRTPTTASLKCRLGSKPCKDGRGCVLYRNVCDGQIDCKDGSDEQNCKRQCRPGQFRCTTDGRCIEKNLVCDETPQCLDKSDETGCQKASGMCVMRCDWNTHCIPEDFICNGIKDCQDGADEVNCAISRTSQGSCESPSFLCPGTSVCVSQAEMCDRRDCPDGSDAAACIDLCASPGDFLCKDRKKCVERNLVCDSRSHCFDGSDEVGCPTMAPTTSTTGSFKCRVGSKPCKYVRECVLYSHVCDGEMDCKDGSDEEDCELQCNPGQFQCVQGKKCIDFRQVCDGIPQCLDHSDEAGCWKPTKSCSMRCDGNARCIPEVFICNGMRDCWDGSDEADCAIPTPPSPCKTPYVACQGTTLCILQQYLCDGRRDCPDGSDERPCLRNCPYRSDFLCKDRKKCVNKNLLCDARSNCVDGSDEVGCPTTTPTTLMTASLKCRVGSKPCSDGQECVLYSHVCDGEMDCKDGSDEADCSVNCKEGEFQCAHGKKCIETKQVCDGKPQCQDFSDESDCFVRTKSCSHRCDNKTRCIPENFLCDGERDCVDGTDESDCGYPAKVLDCKSPAVLCSDGSLCIPHTRLCDGKRDCPDGIDEAFCFDRCPNPGDFLCKDRRKCVELNLVCDGHSHCLDGSDEVSCPTVAPTTSTASLKCRVGSIPCKDGHECVLYSHVCDGEIDCKDGSDEDDCELQCKPDQFHCAHGRMCIDKKLVCDGTPQCQDRSDETDCFTRSHDCKHRCDNKTRCIPESFLCDGEKDCVDATDEANCDRVTSSHMDTPTKLVCNAPSVLCQKTSKCLAQSQLCDGNTDCPDGSDERSCIYTCPDSGQFLCKDRRQCILKALVCDGYSHCSDGSDEMQCPSCAMRCDGKVCLTKQHLCDGKPDCRDGSDEKNCYRVLASASSPVRCPLGSKPCKDGKECVLYSHVCDGEKDCKDGSDERGCERRCKKGQFQCAHGRKCIDLKLVCDGTPQCQDRSDEINCVKLSEECNHACDNRTRCIPEAFLCDGEKDCVDGSDEDSCVVEHCPNDRFQCSNGQCVAMILHCDGYADCRDHSDEKGCPQPPHCPAEQLCPHTHQCLLKEWFCDGDKDCSDGFDEKNCEVTPLECGEFQWSCASKIQCIPQMWKCDGMKDCDDGSDESGCGQVKCPTHLFRCGIGECVQPDLVCNRVPNCVDGSDEGLGCMKNNCSSISLSCQHYCISTPHGARCGCKIGFRLHSDGLNCTDIDECTEIQPDVCSHNCLNTLGSYLCQCHPEYILEPDGQSCKTSEEPSLLVSGQYELLSLGLRSFSIHALITPGHKSIFSLDYDQKERCVYWVSLEEASIKYAFHGEKNKIGTIVKGVKSDSIAVDWIGRNLYWVDGAAGQILAVRLGSSIVAPQNYTVILDEDLEQPRSLVLLPQKGMMFWSEIGVRSQIERSSMDGSERKVVINHGLSWPISITVDILTDRLYWTDEKLKYIGSATLDGENMRVLQLSEMASPFSVAVFNDFVYWSDTRRRSIQGANKLTGKNRKVVLKRPSQPFSLKVVHPFLQPNVTSPCERLKCSHTCLLAPGLKAVCRCPAGLLLAADELTCSSFVESSSFLLLLSPTMITQIFTQSLQETGLKNWPVHRAFALRSVNEASNFDLLLKDRTVFLADAVQGSVAKLKLSSSGFRAAGHLLQLKGDLVTALAVDWVSDNLYWSSIRSPQLYVTSPGGKYTLLVLQGELQETISIALHPPTGRLCFTAVSRRGSELLPQVDCAHMDGSNRTLLWSKAKMPISLAFSDTGTALYWADTGAGSISSIDIDGSNYKEYNTGPAFIVSFARIEDIIFWVTLENGTIKVWYTDGFNSKQMWFEVKTNIVELKAYSKSSQKGTNFCSENNGGCSHLCLPYPSGRTCRCARDYLSINGTKCLSNLKCPTGSKACRDGHKCIHAAKFCDQVPDCQDGSDEDCGVKSKSGPWTAELSPTQTEVSVKNLDSRSCDAERCSKHGKCVTVKGEVVCKCEKGYSGDLCQNTGSSRTALALTLTFLFGGALLAAVIMKKRRVHAAGLHATDKEMLVTNKEECTTFSQNFANELYNPEEDPMSPAITTPAVS